MTGQSSGGFNPYVHGARGLFSAMVYLYHVHNSGLPTFGAFSGTAGDFLFGSFKFGVELFFAISGIVIVGALARAPSIGGFAWDRVARILPTLWASLLVIIVLSLIAGRHLPLPLPLLANFFTPPPMFDVPMVHPAAWSLGYEMTFYMLCAAAWALRARGVRAWLFIAIGAGAVLVLFFPRALLIPAGVMIAAGLARPAWVDRLARHPMLMTLLFLVTWRAVDLTASRGVFLLNPLAIDPGEWLRLLPFMLVAGLIGGASILGIVQGNGLMGRLLQRPTMQWLGTISYSFYLWHPVCMAAVKASMQGSGLVQWLGPWSQIAFLLLCLPVSLAISWWSQQTLEVRVTRWLRGLGKRKGAAPTTATGPTPAMTAISAEAPPPRVSP